jgi:hypothetical protein
MFADAIGRMANKFSPQPGMASATQHNQVRLVRSRKLEDLLGRMAGPHLGLNRDSLPDSDRLELGLDIFEKFVRRFFFHVDLIYRFGIMRQRTPHPDRRQPGSELFR